MNSAVSIATLEYFVGRPRAPLLTGHHSAIAASVNRIEKSPRRFSKLLYSGQFVTLYYGFSNLWQRSSLCLYGTCIPGKKSCQIIHACRDPSNYSTTPRSDNHSGTEGASHQLADQTDVAGAIPKLSIMTIYGNPFWSYIDSEYSNSSWGFRGVACSSTLYFSKSNYSQEKSGRQ